MSKKIALLQSNYIPWKGYFDLIKDVDEFYLYDEVQYTKNDWRNRNQILTSQGKQWLTIPVRHEFIGQPINEIVVANKKWGKKHWNTIKTNYGKAKNFKKIAPFFEAYYLNNSDDLLTTINEKLLKICCELLGVATPIKRSAEFNLQGDKNERIVDLCKKVGASTYISGPAAKDYLDESLFELNGIEVQWYKYNLSFQYSHLHSDQFDPYVSIIDYLFCND